MVLRLLGWLLHGPVVLLVLHLDLFYAIVSASQNLLHAVMRGPLPSGSQSACVRQNGMCIASCRLLVKQAA